MPREFSRKAKLYFNGKEFSVDLNIIINPNFSAEMGVMVAEAALAQACDDKEFCRKRGGLYRLKGELLEARRRLAKSS